jgi:glycosyltransferase involved in cell wall biosynthesis
MPVRNEETNLVRIAGCLEAQTQPPAEWLIVDTGSTDGTRSVIAELCARLPWVRSIDVAGETVPTRGGPIVRAFTRGAAALRAPAEVIVKLDADLSFEVDYFERLLDAFAEDPRLGLASGVCLELQGGEWRPLYGTRCHVWGASRAYRRQALQDVLPLEERQGWDEIDSIKAQLKGWHARTLLDLPFRHHRPEGERDGSRRRWADQGETAHFMGYRFSYLLLRAAYRSLKEPVALSMIGGYARAAARHQPRVADEAVRAHLRRQQSVQRLPLRFREALGRES